MVLYDAGLMHSAPPEGQEELHGAMVAYIAARVPDFARTAIAITYWANGFSVALEGSLCGRVPKCGPAGEAMELGHLHRAAETATRAFSFHPWGAAVGGEGVEVARAQSRERFCDPLAVLRPGDLADGALLQPPHALRSFPPSVLAAVKALLPPHAPFDALAPFFEWRLYNQMGGRHRKLCHRAQLIARAPPGGGGGGGGGGEGCGGGGGGECRAASPSPPEPAPSPALERGPPLEAPPAPSVRAGGAGAAPQPPPALALLQPQPASAPAAGGAETDADVGGEPKGAAPPPAPSPAASDGGADSPPTPTAAACGLSAGLLAAPPPAALEGVAFLSVVPVAPPPDLALAIFSNGILIDGLSVEGCTTLVPAAPPESDDASVLAHLQKAGLLLSGGRLSFLEFEPPLGAAPAGGPAQAYMRAAKRRAADTLRSVFCGAAPEWLRLEARKAQLRVRVVDIEGSGYTHMDAEKKWKGKVLYEKARSLAGGAGPLEPGQVQCGACGKGVAPESLQVHQLRCGRQPPGGGKR